MTLIELLVAIVIMVTVIGAVIPILSPNNDVRKIREAARELNSLISQAQAQAARNGRPVGVAFHEYGASGSLSGMALEAYLISEPQPFIGFSENSRVWLQNLSGTIMYGPNGNGGTTFAATYNNYPMCQISFVLAASGMLPDYFPPRMLRIGDLIEVAGNEFLVCDDADPTTMPNKVEGATSSNPNGTGFLESDLNASPPSGAALNCIWINYNGQALADGQNHLWSYKIRRQPVPGSDQPLQFPRGIGIDLQASGAHGAQQAEIFDVDVSNLATPPQIADTVGIVFAPNGALQDLYFNNYRIERADQVILNIGRYELGNGFQRPEDYDFMNNPVSTGDMDVFRQRRDRLNWLNPDSMWVTINRAGRVVTSENHTFNPTNDSQLGPVVTVMKNGQPYQPFYTDFQNDSGGQLLLNEFTTQREHAHEYAEAMSSTGGRGR